MKKNQPAYPIVIEWSDEDACFVAHTPAIKYCTAHGETYEEAAREMNSAIEGWLEIARERGTPIPEPGPAIEEVQGAAALLNINELARRMGVPAQTLYAKVRRGSSFNYKETRAVANTLTAVGIHLMPQNLVSLKYQSVDTNPARRRVLSEYQAAASRAPKFSRKDPKPPKDEAKKRVREKSMT